MTNYEGFSKEELDSFINAAKRLASKSVLTSVISIIENAGGNAHELIEDIKKHMLDYAGYVQCTFKEITWKLNISLSIVEKGYRTSIDIPNESYAQDLFDQYNVLKRIAVAYWQQFLEDNAGLYKRICDQCPGTDFSRLIIDPDNPTTMYFDPNSSKRIGIFCYYMDENGRPFYKVTDKKQIEKS
jgi:hypothetical protein